MLQQEYERMHAQEMEHWWFRGRRRVLLDLLRRVLPPAGRPRILDFGCGTGGNTSAFAKLGRVIGVEPDAGAVAMARGRAAAEYCRGSGTALPFAPGSFDAVVASDVLEHIEDDRAAAAEIARVLRPGGALVFTVPAHPWLFSGHDSALLHYRRYTRQTLLQVLTAGGLVVERLSYWNATLFPLVCAYRFLARTLWQRDVRSNMGVTPRAFNAPLAGVMALEAAVLRHASLPWGISFVGIARRS